MRRPTIRLIALLACVAPITLACSSNPSAKAEPRDSFWLPSAKESFVTIVNDTSYTVVPDETHDVMIHEQSTGRDSRLTWILRVPRGASLGVNHRVGAGGDAPVRAWMIEQVDGEPSTLVPATGTVVLHNRTLGSTVATVVLEAETSPVSAGSILPGVTRLTLRDSWSRQIREPNYLVQQTSRSGAPKLIERDPDDPFFGYSDIEFVEER